MSIRTVNKLNCKASILLLFSIFGFMLTMWANSSENEAENIRVLFEQKFNAWRNYCKSSSYSDFNSYFENEAFLEIKKLGALVIPNIVEKINGGKKENFDFAPMALVEALHRLTKVNFHITKEKKMYQIEEFPQIGLKKSINLYHIWLLWWYEGRRQTPQRFNMLHGEWQGLKKKRKIEEAQEKYQRIIDMGIIVLPYLIEKITEGDTALIPAVSKLTDGEVKDLKPEEYVEWWQQNKEKWYIPIEDEPIEKEEKEIKKDEE